MYTWVVADLVYLGCWDHHPSDEGQTQLSHAHDEAWGHLSQVHMGASYEGQDEGAESALQWERAALSGPVRASASSALVL